MPIGGHFNRLDYVAIVGFWGATISMGLVLLMKALGPWALLREYYSYMVAV